MMAVRLMVHATQFLLGLDIQDLSFGHGGQDVLILMLPWYAGIHHMSGFYPDLAHLSLSLYISCLFYFPSERLDNHCHFLWLITALQTLPT
jgi:hypothetical protein